METPQPELFSDDSSEVPMDRSGLDNDADDFEIGDKIEYASDNDDKSEESIPDPETLVQHKEPTDLPFVGPTLVNMTKNVALHRSETCKYLINFFTLH